MLYALGRFQRNGDTPIRYSQAEERLGRLLAQVAKDLGVNEAPSGRRMRDGWMIMV